MLGPMSVDMYLPALPAMARSFQVPPASLQLTVTAFLLGFGLGPLVLGPLSDAVGRRRVLIGCTLVFIIASLLCASANTVEELIGYRVIQALGGGSATTIARTVIHDVQRGDHAARSLSALMMVLSLSLMIAPTVGSQLLHFFGWRAIFLLLAALGLTSLISLVSFLPETLPRQQRQSFDLISIVRGYGLILRSRGPLGFTLAGAFAGGAMFAYLAATPFIFIDGFGLDPSVYGVLFAINMIGAILINGINMRLVTRYGYRRMLAMASAALLVTGLALTTIALTGFGGLLGIAAAVFAIVGLAHVMGTNGLTGALDLVRERAGMMSASFSSCRFAAGVLATSAVGFLSDGTVWSLAVVVLASAVAAALASAFALIAKPC